jgi:predicted ATPase/class 3 adenylate cyclase
MTEERRLVTVLFADVVGSTALGEALDPEDVRPLLARLFAIARDAVEQHGGRVEKYIGDAVMAVFGLPVAHDDDPARALSAALNLRDRVQADAMLGDRLPIRLGVNTGEVIATREPQADQFLVTGDPVNTAARLQQAAEEWAIVVGERTVRAVGDRFVFGSPVALEAKGKATPMPARPLLGPSPVAATRPRHPLVGRDADLMQLELVGRRAFEEHRPYLVSIVAPAGVGKSRLLEEFLDRVSPGPARIALAQCLPYGQRLTYWPMRAILLSILELTEDAAPDMLREALRDWLATAGDADASTTAEQLAATFGASESEVGDRLALFAAWRRFIELAAERAPLALVIEDLHWSSDSLLDLIEAILQPHADVPLLMIALARPELLDRRPSWGGGRRNAVSIALEPLADASVAEVVEDLLASPAPEIVRAVVDRAEGNPFYAGEIVRSLLERLGFAPSPDAVGAAIAALPDTVHATVLARLDALEPAARRAVQLGAVLGRSFPSSALAELEPSLSPESVTLALDALIDRDIIRPSGLNRYVFRHILIREVAYGTLTRAERSRLHAGAGTWLEGQAVSSGREDELAELIAFHFREAAALGTLLGEAPATDLARKAFEWLRRAAESAQAGAATTEAARHLEAAIELAPEGARAELYERLGEIWVGGQQALGAFQKAYEAGRKLGLGRDQELRTLAQKALVASRWAGSVSVRYEPEQSRTLRMELRELRAEASTDRARLLGLLAEAFLATPAHEHPSADDIEDAAGTSAQAFELASRLGEVDLISASLDAEWSVAGADDRHAEMLAISRLRLALPGLATSERLDAHITTAWSLFLLGQLEEAERVADGVRTGLASGQASAWVMGASAWRVQTLWALGRWDEALVEAGRCEQAWRESQIHAPGYAVGGFVAAFSIAEARRDSVEVDRWRGAVDTILGRVDPGSRIRYGDAYVRNDLAALADATVANFQRFTSRTDHVHLALARLVDFQYPMEPDLIRALLAYVDDRGLQLLAAQARRAIGVLDHDGEELRRSLEIYRAMGARTFVARVTTELGEVRDEVEMIDEGISMLEALGDLDQAERVARRRRPDRA